jgi:hypothetical protein
MSFFFYRFPAKRIRETKKDTFDAALSEIASCSATPSRDPDHFVFSANTPFLARFSGLVKVVDELRSVLDDLSRLGTFNVLRHGCPS